LGAELDSETERARELVAGIDAVEVLRLPLKSDKALLKAREAHAGDILAARDVRRRYRAMAVGAAQGTTPGSAPKEAAAGGRKARR